MLWQDIITGTEGSDDKSSDDLIQLFVNPLFNASGILSDTESYVNDNLLHILNYQACKTSTYADV